MSENIKREGGREEYIEASQQIGYLQRFNVPKPSLVVFTAFLGLAFSKIFETITGVSTSTLISQSTGKHVLSIGTFLARLFRSGGPQLART